MKETVIEEDYKRTEMYRLRLAEMVPVTAKGSDLMISTILEMNQIYDRSNGDNTRAVQLINKTNVHFKWIRLSDKDINKIWMREASSTQRRLGIKTAVMEILSCLLDSCGARFGSFLQSFSKMRWVRFFYWLFRNLQPTGFEFLKTERNESAQRFFFWVSFFSTKQWLVDYK